MTKKKNAAAQALSALRMKKMTPAERTAVATLGGKARAAQRSPAEQAATAAAISPEKASARAKAAWQTRRKNAAKKNKTP